jgi:sarcosine oxidase gamma subunit
MAEIERAWPRLPDRGTHRLDMPRIAIRNLTGLAQSLVSGNLAAAAERAGIDAAGVGALATASGDRYSVRLARDRLLVVSTGEEALEPGWHEAGYAVTGMSGALEVFELSGPLSTEIVKRATTLFRAGLSRSAATSFAGVTCYLYRFGDGQTVRLHLDRGLAPNLWAWLRALLDLMTEDGASSS